MKKGSGWSRKRKDLLHGTDWNSMGLIQNKAGTLQGILHRFNKDFFI